nr:uncharacterized protein LOC120976959 [Aegilops tauschii subsp. strangulata]
MPIWVRVHDIPPIMLDEGVAWKLGAELGEVLEVDTDSRGKIWGDFIRIHINHDVDEPLRDRIKSRDIPSEKVFSLEVKYERVPRFCGYCGYLGHGQRDCKLPEDLHEMRFTATMRASPYKKSNSRGGYVAPVANSARRLLSFGREVQRERSSHRSRTNQEKIPEEVLLNPQVQPAIAAVSALKVSDDGGSSRVQTPPRPTMLPKSKGGRPSEAKQSGADGVLTEEEGIKLALSLSPPFQATDPEQIDGDTVAAAMEAAPGLAEGITPVANLDPGLA